MGQFLTCSEDHPDDKGIAALLGYTIERMDIPLLGPAGTNLLGLILAFAAFLPLGILKNHFGGRFEGVLNLIGGSIVFAADWIYRRLFDILLEPEHGGRLLYLPLWIWGVIWMISGIILLVVEWIKG